MVSYSIPSTLELVFKRRPLCSGADTGALAKLAITGLRKQADFPLVFHTRKLEQPAYEAKQMTTVKAVGTASRKGLTWAAIDWVADITYIRLRAEFVYLAVILDGFSRKVVGWALERR